MLRPLCHRMRFVCKEFVEKRFGIRNSEFGIKNRRGDTAATWNPVDRILQGHRFSDRMVYFSFPVPCFHIGVLSTPKSGFEPSLAGITSM